LWSLAKWILTGIVYKPIICRVLLKLTIWFVCFRPLTTFNRPEITVLEAFSILNSWFWRSFRLDIAPLLSFSVLFKVKIRTICKGWNTIPFYEFLTRFFELIPVFNSSIWFTKVGFKGYKTAALLVKLYSSLMPYSFGVPRL